MKKVLIISPYFPPVNAADMQRVRMSLPYFKELGWVAEIVTVNPVYSDMTQDEQLMKSIPADIIVHQVKAFDKKLTAKFGLGSIALRSLWFYCRKVSSLLKSSHYDLIYFSTTQFPVCALGPYWKKRFKVAYIIDLQDPWHSDYYRNKPKDQRPPKYWFSYYLNKYTEAIAMKKVDGLISVSQLYIDDVKKRYERLKNIPERVITFGYEGNDLDIAVKHQNKFEPLLNRTYKNVVYIGRGGQDMRKALSIVFGAMQKGIKEQPLLFENLRLAFIGTSYAAAGQGKLTILPLALTYGLEKYIAEYTDRISYYHTLITLIQSDALLVPGSDAQGYTASKLFPYLNTRKPLLALLNKNSPAADVLREYHAPYNFTFDEPEKALAGSFDFLLQIAQGALDKQAYDERAIRKYAANALTAQQCSFFGMVTGQPV